MADAAKVSFSPYHESRDANFSLQPGLKVKTSVFEGNYDELESIAENFVVGKHPNASSSGTLDGIDTGYYVASLQLVRTNGKRGRLSVSLSQFQEDVAVWGLEMAEIQKPIRTWKANAENKSDRPDLALLANWESQAGKQGLESEYNAYKYNGTELSGNTLTLAKMIREEGIDHYAIYTPVITCTTRLNELPSDIGSNIGKIASPNANGDTSLAALFALATEWLKTTDRIQGAIDGTYTRVQQWTGADKWNDNLYESATSDSSGS